MTFFRDFTIPEWKLFSGNLLMFITCAFYIAWWSVAFRPNGHGAAASSAFFISIALLAGVAAIAVLSIGINSLSEPGPSVPVLFILIGAAVSYIFILEVTKTAFHRPATSELLVMFIWAAVEFSVIDVLLYSGRFGFAQAVTLVILVALATCIGIVCYVLYYRLEGMSSFLDGLVPLVVDAVAVLFILASQAFS